METVRSAIHPFHTNDLHLQIEFSAIPMTFILEYSIINVWEAVIQI